MSRVKSVEDKSYEPWIEDNWSKPDYQESNTDSNELSYDDFLDEDHLDNG